MNIKNQPHESKQDSNEAQKWAAYDQKFDHDFHFNSGETGDLNYGGTVLRNQIISHIHAHTIPKSSLYEIGGIFGKKLFIVLPVGDAQLKRIERMLLEAFTLLYNHAKTENEKNTHPIPRERAIIKIDPENKKE